MKNVILLLFMVLLLAGGCTSKPPKETAYSSYMYEHKPMPMDTAQSLKYQWAQKEVLASKQIDGMESLEKWELDKPANGENVARIDLSDEKVTEGKSSIKFVSPTKKPVQLPNGGRYWGRENLTRVFKAEDLSEYNRITVDIFPVFKGFRQLYLTLILHNDANVPDKYNKSGWHTVQLINNQWNKLIMEIPHLPHDQVNGITISYGLQGNEPDAADTIVYYADNLMLEKVKTDYFEGWGTDEAISFTHSGYNSDSKKTAFTSINSGGKFRVVELTTGKTVLEKDPVLQTSYIGTFSVFDFSELKTPGKYKIVYGNLESKPFPVNEDVWLSTLEKTINLLYVLRCGYEMPGIHLKCHTDWYTVFKGDTIEMSGGWHDAGDLSQSFARTAETVGILFKLARKYQKKDPRLSDRLLEEGLWGLKWVHKNRFDGLQVLGWTTHDHYSDGKIGNFDDTPTQPGTRGGGGGVDNYYSIIANVEASLALKKTDPDLAEKSRQFAIDDWGLLVKNNTRWNTASLSIAIMAGSKLYGLTKSDEIKNQIISYADTLLSFQQTEPMNWSTPLNGFFYNNKGSDRIFGYAAGFSVASPIMGLVELCKLFPGDKKYPLWFKSVQLHGNYLKTIAGFTAPYYMIPANVYKLGTAEDAQVLNGVKMDDTHYLRMFPVWTEHRGNNANVLSFGIGLAAANQLLKDPEMNSIAQSQLEWVVGKNPFSQSLMYGEGYNFSTQYAAFPGDVTGGLPVGIQTKLDSDIPYWPAAVLHNYKEIWIHPSCRWLVLLDYLDLK
jgi:hypothetical protein